MTTTTGNGLMSATATDMTPAMWLLRRVQRRVFRLVDVALFYYSCEGMHWIGDRSNWLADPRYPGESIFHTFACDWGNSFVRNWLRRLLYPAYQTVPDGTTVASLYYDKDYGWMPCVDPEYGFGNARPQFSVPPAPSAQRPAEGGKADG